MPSNCSKKLPNCEEVSAAWLRKIIPTQNIQSLYKDHIFGVLVVLFSRTLYMHFISLYLILYYIFCYLFYPPWLQDSSCLGKRYWTQDWTSHTVRKKWSDLLRTATKRCICEHWSAGGQPYLQSSQLTLTWGSRKRRVVQLETRLTGCNKKLSYRRETARQLCMST